MTGGSILLGGTSQLGFGVRSDAEVSSQVRQRQICWILVEEQLCRLECGGNFELRRNSPMC